MIGSHRNPISMIIVLPQNDAQILILLVVPMIYNKRKTGKETVRRLGAKSIHIYPAQISAFPSIYYGCIKQL